MRADETEKPQTRLVVSVGLLCFAILSLPLLAIQHPPILDLPNHLARLHILANPGDADLARYYRINWAFLPNLGFDLAGYAMAQFLPVYVVGRVSIGIALAIGLSAPVALHWALYGRFSPLPLAAGVFLFSRVLQMGFVGYFLGAGLAVWAFAIWLMLRRSGALKRFLFVQAAALVILVCHLYAVAVLAVLIVVSTAAGAWEKAEAGALARLARVAKACSIAALPFVLPFALVLLSSTGGGGIGIEYQPVREKLILLLASVVLHLSAATLVLALATLALFLALICLNRARADNAVVWPIIALLGVSLLLPDKLLSSENADWRVVLPMLLVIAGAAPEPGRRGATGALVVAFAFAANSAASYGAWRAWQAGDRIVDELRVVLGPFPQGAHLLPYLPGIEQKLAFEAPSLYHVAAHGVIGKSAMVPTIFALPGHQPIEFTAPYQNSAEWYHWLHGARAERPADFPQGPDNFILGIRTGHLPPESRPPLPVDAVVEASSEHFTLYRMK